MQRLGYLPALDGLRGIAILLVIAFHAGVLPGGSLGVDLFFVLSGYLITSLLLQEHHSTGRIDLPAFFLRRGLRLLPALVVMLVAYAGIVSLQGGDWFAPVGVGMAYVMNVLNAAGMHFEGLRHLWSLAAEEQFYLTWPFVMVFALRRQWSLRRITALLGGLLALSVAANLALTLSGASWDRLYYGPDIRFDGLLAGCLLAVLRVLDRRRVGQVAGRYAAPALVLLAWMLLFDYVTVAMTPAAHNLVTLVCTVLVAATVDGRFRVLECSPLVGLGKVSYSAYLWNSVIIVFFGVPTALAVILTFVIALLSYRLVELPAQRFKLLIARRRMVPALA